jgi:hypothetical protein
MITMKKKFVALCGAMLMLSTAAYAAEPTLASTVCYPTAVTRSEDGSEIRKMYDLGPTDDPTGIPRSDFEQDGYHYTLTDLLKQEMPENESRQHTETVSLASKSKDMADILALLPQTREFITDDGLTGVLTLQLDTVQVEVSGYGSSTKEVTASRSYPNLDSQDTSYIPKEIEDSGHALTLQTIDWQRTGGDDSERYTALATYSGTTTNSYVKGYTVTADYAGTVSRINLNKTRYVAIYEGKAIEPEAAEEPSTSPDSEQTATSAPFRWGVILVPIGIVALVGVGIGAGIFAKRCKEDEGEETE